MSRVRGTVKPTNRPKEYTMHNPLNLPAIIAGCALAGTAIVAALVAALVVGAS